MAELGSAALAWCVASLLLAGLVKGVTGIGIPLVSISLLTMVVSVPQSVLLLPVPIIVANIWQSLASGQALATCRRFWPMLAGVAAGMMLGAGALASLREAPLLIVIGALLSVFAVTDLMQLRFTVDPRHEKLAGVAVGGLGGVLGGVSSVMGPPIIMLLVSLRLGKEQFVGTIATIYLFAGVMMTVAFASYGVLDARQLLWSALATIPLLAGLLLGTLVRRAVSEDAFRRLLMLLLLCIGLNLLRRGLL
jgi:uncharacterized membrane protein YfcA